MPILINIIRIHFSSIYGLVYITFLANVNTEMEISSTFIYSKYEEIEIQLNLL